MQSSSFIVRYFTRGKYFIIKGSLFTYQIDDISDTTKLSYMRLISQINECR